MMMEQMSPAQEDKEQEDPNTEDGTAREHMERVMPVFSPVNLKDYK
jgi:hypothetical protein